MRGVSKWINLLPKSLHIQALEYKASLVFSILILLELRPFCRPVAMFLTFRSKFPVARELLSAVEWPPSPPDGTGNAHRGSCLSVRSGLNRSQFQAD